MIYLKGYVLLFYAVKSLINMIITNETIFQAGFDIAGTWRGHDGANDEGNRQVCNVVIPRQFEDDIKSLCAYAGLSELTKGMKLQMSLSEILDIIPKARRRIDSYRQLIAFLDDEMGVTLILTSRKTKYNGK